MRVVPIFTLYFPIYEQVRKLLGLEKHVQERFPGAVFTYPKGPHEAKEAWVEALDEADAAAEESEPRLQRLLRGRPSVRPAVAVWCGGGDVMRVSG